MRTAQLRNAEARKSRSTGTGISCSRLHLKHHTWQKTSASSLPMKDSQLRLISDMKQSTAPFTALVFPCLTDISLHMITRHTIRPWQPHNIFLPSTADSWE